MSCVQTEMMADFPEMEIELDVVRSDVFQELKSLDAWVYRRREDIVRISK